MQCLGIAEPNSILMTTLGEKSELLNFVEAIFENIKEKNISGVHIKMNDGNIVKIEMYEFGGEVTVFMDNVEMGNFKESESRCYKYNFYQKYRVGIREGLTVNEVMMKSICYNNADVKFIGV